MNDEKIKYQVSSSSVFFEHNLIVISCLGLLSGAPLTKGPFKIKDVSKKNYATKLRA